MRHITPRGLALIQRFEGFSATIYPCPAGYPTIGYGHVVRPDEQWRFTGGITEEQAASLLQQDVQQAERAVLRLISMPLTDGQFDALVSFTFNVGADALRRSTLRRIINQGHHAAAPNALKQWIWAGRKKLDGLIHRRNAEAALYVGH